MPAFIIFKIGQQKYSRSKSRMQTSREIGICMNIFATHCESCEGKYEVLRVINLAKLHDLEQNRKAFRKWGLFIRRADKIC